MWRLLRARGPVRCEFTLPNGQCFGWRRLGATGEWVGVLGRHVVRLRDTLDGVEYCCVHPSNAHVDEMVADFLRLDEDLGQLYAGWASQDERMKTIAGSLPGVRLLRQEPWECLVSFLCSSNNNIKRIQQMLTALRTRYGERLCELEDGEACFAFPAAPALAAASELDLRALGLGYRAKFVLGTARMVTAQPAGWLESLRVRPRAEVQAALLQLPGVGRKVADCVALFSLDQLDAVPVDVHVWNIACRDMDASLASARSLTPRIYEHVGDLFRTRFRPHAGWAHSVLFTAELPDFAAHLPADLASSMREFKRQEREAKAAARGARKAARGARGEEEGGDEEAKAAARGARSEWDEAAAQGAKGGVLVGANGVNNPRGGSAAAAQAAQPPTEDAPARKRRRRKQ